MYQRLKTIARKRLIILDLCSLALSYLLALITRYSMPLRVVRWQAQSYMTVLLLATLIYSILYLFYDSRKPPIMDQDQIDVVLTVLKNAILLFILLMGYLYCIKELSKFSRIVFGSWFLYFLLVDCLARQWYRLPHMHPLCRTVSRRTHMACRSRTRFFWIGRRRTVGTQLFP